VGLNDRAPAENAMSRTWLGRKISSRSAAKSSAAPAGGTVFPGEAVPAVPQSAPAPVAPLITIDALGRKCPIPIIWLSEQIRDVPIGSVIAVLADDPAAYSDIPAWCEMKSHSLAFREVFQTGWSFGIRRNY
jgi:tRNA 2-thiouridine synthesizing protein A